MSEASSLPSGDMTAFREVLKSSKNVIAVAGAGLSAASGIPTFRGTGGMWRRYDAMSLATPQAFKKNPSLSWQFYHYRREIARKAMPNTAHMALASFSLTDTRHRIAPNSTFTLITQNVDGLSQRALDHAVATASAPHTSTSTNEQPSILEMHGRLFDVKCTSKSCGHTEFNLDSPICVALGGTEIQTEAGVLDPHIPTSDLPHCSKCNALARPGVVWFGESPHHMEIIDRIVDEADLCLVVGTSSTVYPAAMYASLVQDNGGNVAVFNLDRSEGDEDADYLFLGPCEDTLPMALGFSDGGQ